MSTASTQQLMFANSPLSFDLRDEDLTTFRKFRLVLARTIDFVPNLIQRADRAFARCVRHPGRWKCLMMVAYLAGLVLFVRLGMRDIMQGYETVRESFLEAFSFGMVWLSLGTTLLFIAAVSCDGVLGHRYDKLRKRYEIPGELGFARTEESISKHALSIRSDSLNNLSDFVRQSQTRKDWAAYIISVLSLGKSSSSPATIPTYGKRIRSASMEQSKEIISEMKKDYDIVLREINDLVELWDGALGGIVSMDMRYPADMEQMKRVADRFDIELMLDTYYADVPVEDIVA